mmetsp:Transcript_34886/g.35066  ORF Transcript_34886/g.35066 Transcript_34886/m.35066 type:complete len:107 (+) Transcript_34886:855-1175(+)
MDNGTVEKDEGIIFADLLSNIFRSLIMGLMQTDDVLGLPVGIPIAWVSASSYFQSWDVIHLSIRMGFCKHRFLDDRHQNHQSSKLVSSSILDRAIVLPPSFHRAIH